MKIAILDDERIYLEQIKWELARRFPNVVHIRAYTDSKEMLYDLEEHGICDIYFLDVELGQANGLDIAREVRKRNPDALFIFITAYAKYAAESYDVQAYQYILKSQLAKKLPMVLDNIENKLSEQAKEIYVIDTPFCYVRMWITDILYIYKEGKNAVFLTEQGEYRQRRTVSCIWEQLENKQFVWVDRGVIVNIRKVHQVTKNELILDNGAVVKISRSNQKRVRAEIADYWRAQM